MPAHTKQYYKEKFFKTKQDLAVCTFENKIEPELMRRIEHLETILLFISPTNKEYRIIKNILENAKALRMPSDNQMNYASFIFYKHNILGKVD